FRNQGKNIRLISDPLLAVYTYAPQGVLAFLHQRVRWISKTGKVKDHFATSLGIFQTILSIVFYSSLGIYLYIDQYSEMLLLFCAKTGLDLIFYARYFLRFRRKLAWVLIPVYQVLFPVYNLLILFLIPTFKAKWKDRKVVV
ncbi:MAG: hypothetical protein ACKO4Y_08015, partial [Flavobacteriales bacterium]